ncbi:hypothetical protein LSUB1_G007291 [Lachnellula subtilissima]|uniref:Rhodopsin domain-containing protein n=1 Tax=Lachnellula subtilissima TaxID=602034 RepID=A0A8H8RG22_9HELO|nr:hypothetical protein LSUB1_G007291 [Lachnellula subtilissima]
MNAISRDPEFLREEWALYGVGTLVLLTRFATRIKTVGFKGFQGDDYMSILVLALFTVDAATVHIVYYSGTNVEGSVLQQIRPLTATEIDMFTHGSKEQLVAWYSYTALIWAMKGTMLFFFNRLTFGLDQHRYIKWLAIGCGLSYVAVFLTITLGCFPTRKNWQVVPDPGKVCTLKLQNFLVTVVLNVITDAAILAIPVPLLWRLKVPLRRKLVVALLLCSGLFVICAAIVRVALTLGAHPSAKNINRWGVRETIVGIVAINLPILRPLFNKTFWSKGTFKSSSPSHGTSCNPDIHGNYEMSASFAPKARGGTSTCNEGASSVPGKNRSHSKESLGSLAGSEEFIIEPRKRVTVETTFQITSEDLEKVDSEQGWGIGGVGVGASKASVEAQAVDDQIMQSGKC